MVGVVLTVIFVVLMGVIAFHAGKDEDAEMSAHSAGKPSNDTPSKSAPSPGDKPESLEGVLVAQLGAGHISRRQYLRAMEWIAARDEQRHPLAVPPDLGPTAP